MFLVRLCTRHRRGDRQRREGKAGYVSGVPATSETAAVLGALDGTVREVDRREAGVVERRIAGVSRPTSVILRTASVLSGAPPPSAAFSAAPTKTPAGAPALH